MQPNQGPPPPRGSIMERTLYGAIELLLSIQVCIFIVLGTLSFMVHPDTCGEATIHRRDYWIMAANFFGLLSYFFVDRLLSRTLWRWFYAPVIFVVVGCFVMHAFAAFFFIEYNHSCGSYLQCMGCDVNGKRQVYFLVWWILISVLAAINLAYIPLIWVLRSYTEATGLLWMWYGASDSPWNYYQRFPDSWGYDALQSTGYASSEIGSSLPTTSKSAAGIESTCIEVTKYAAGSLVGVLGAPPLKNE